MRVSVFLLRGRSLQTVVFKMALPGALLVRLGALRNVHKCAHRAGGTASNGGAAVRWYRAKPRSLQESGTSDLQTRRGERTVSGYPGLGNR